MSRGQRPVSSSEAALVAVQRAVFVSSGDLCPFEQPLHPPFNAADAILRDLDAIRTPYHPQTGVLADRTYLSHNPSIAAGRETCSCANFLLVVRINLAPDGKESPDSEGVMLEPEELWDEFAVITFGCVHRFVRGPV